MSAASWALDRVAVKRRKRRPPSKMFWVLFALLVNSAIGVFACVMGTIDIAQGEDSPGWMAFYTPFFFIHALILRFFWPLFLRELVRWWRGEDDDGGAA